MTDKKSKNVETLLDKSNLDFLKNYETPTAFSLSNPYNIIEFLVFFSPIFFATVIVGMSFMFQNFKGFIYLGFLLAVSCFREGIYTISGAEKFVAKNNLCTMVQYSKYDNSGFNIFIAAFTTFYMCTPMFYFNDYNYMALGGLLVYLFVIVRILVKRDCITFAPGLINFIMGGIAGVIIISLLYAGGSGNYLFFNELSSNKEVCTMPKKQTFRCSVYKNGEMIGSTTN
jgi:hypothetical protein